MSKKITLNNVNSAAKKKYIMKKFILKDINDEEWEILVDVHMSPSKVEDVAKDTMNILGTLKEEYAGEEEKVLNLVEENVFTILMMFLLKHFTNIDIPSGKTAKETLLNYVSFTNGLINLGLLDDILKLFDEGAFQRTSKQVGKYIEDVAKEMIRLNAINEDELVGNSTNDLDEENI